ncbi:Bug family tripartite tricarboxylate transporter substrate binding protein [Diaphorobacter aerolatus]|uniref:Tripartite tricarboxylate transporter substrate binding protein n=1 Tax=Diaphorobacter aerolatus TaxID=1288495 RepID=A0A7H0GH47_9BURK|nr:tripartite tricarboxylate transporter substrate binding protein [Diaphorobacter aerolatus]QNP47613.1 tripartite tricarboxylate transporter substrate binding protein [Diaphorobacter aerolatus]
MDRRNFIGASLTGMAALPFGSAWADDYPKRAIRLINPFPAGSPTDAVARKLAESIAPLLGQPVFIDNKTGAGGSIGTQEVARAVPDGYTMGIAIGDSLISVASLLKNPGYDSRKDLSLICKFSSATAVLFANAQSGIRSLSDLIAKAKAKPESISYASFGQGTQPHLIMASLEEATGAQFVHVPYKGLAPAIQDLLGDVIQVSVGPPVMIAQYMQKKQLYPLATLGPRRTEFLPQVPTFVEQGYKNQFLSESTWWAGVIGPKKLPQAIVDRWNDVVKQAISKPEFAQFLATGAGGQLPTFVGPADFAKELAVEWEMTNALLRKVGVTPQ